MLSSRSRFYAQRTAMVQSFASFDPSEGAQQTIFTQSHKGGFHKGSPNLGLVLGNAKR